jgi:hypothetical protein
MSNYHCQVNGCAFTAKSFICLQTHKKYATHEDRIYFPCPKKHCDMEFKYDFDLREHIHTDHKEKTRKQSLQELLNSGTYSNPSSRATSRNTTPSSSASNTPRLTPRCLPCNPVLPNQLGL